MRVILTLDEDVAARLQDEARRQGSSFKDTVNRVLRRGLAFSERPPQRRRFRVEARDLGLHPGLDYDDPEAFLEQNPLRES